MKQKPCQLLSVAFNHRLLNPNPNTPPIGKAAWTNNPFVNKALALNYLI